MPKTKIYFMGFLANTDSSILNVNLDHEFKIQDISEDKGTRLICTLENLSYVAVSRKLIGYLWPFEKKFYFVGNSFDSDIKMNDEGMLTNYSNVADFEMNLFRGYLDPVIRLMRLFKEGNIGIPLWYYFFFNNNNIPKPVMGGSIFLYPSSGPRYRLEDSEISDLERFIKDIKLPFRQSFLQLAFENFELSYRTDNRNLSFLSLMISLEALFNRGQPELSYTMSRNTAVLLGKDREDSNEIFQKMKELYKKRSDIVHSRKSNIINKDDLLQLRHYVRESIKEIYQIGEDKDKVFYLLNSSAFGNRSCRK